MGEGGGEPVHTIGGEKGVGERACSFQQHVVECGNHGRQKPACRQEGGIPCFSLTSDASARPQPLQNLASQMQIRAYAPSPPRSPSSVARQPLQTGHASQNPTHSGCGWRQCTPSCAPWCAAKPIPMQRQFFYFFFLYFFFVFFFPSCFRQRRAEGGWLRAQELQPEPSSVLGS